jgi:hypothetical protein
MHTVSTLDYNSAATNKFETVPATVRPKAWANGRSLPGTVGSNPAGGMEVCLL